MFDARQSLHIAEAPVRVGRPLRILIVAWSARAARVIAQPVGALLAARGDVEIIFTHPGDSLVGIRVDLIIIGRMNPNMNEYERRWFEEVLELRRHPNCGWIDLS